MVVAILMTVSILMQSSKGGGLASSFGGAGGAGGVLGPRGAASFLQKATTVLATLYIVICLIIGLVGRPSAERRSVVQEQMRQQPQQNLQLPKAPMDQGQLSPQQQPQQPPQEQPPSENQQPQ